MELRRIRGDMIQVFKCENGIDTFGLKTRMNLQGVGRTRGYSLKLKKAFSRLDVRKFSFFERVVDEWNVLPEFVVSADSVLDFKINIELHFVYLFCVLVYVLKYGNAGSYHCFIIIILSQ